MQKVSPQLNTHLMHQLIPLKTLYLQACTFGLPQLPPGCTFGSTSNTSYPKNFLRRKDNMEIVLLSFVFAHLHAYMN